MRKKIMMIAALVAMIGGAAVQAQPGYVPSKENLESRAQFDECRLGIFIHWGLYSTFAQGEWYMQNAGITLGEYSKVADAFYPHRFNAREWVRAFKDAGAGYVTFTSRHHEGFSMWKTDESDYNIVDATPYKRDVIRQLADACHDENLRLHLYYSHLDWGREDYPMGRTGKKCGKDSARADYDHYFKFMNAQLTELLTRYGEIGAIWFDGMWDHDEDKTPFDWRLDEQYALIHKLQPGCLVGNNHHGSVIPGEDIQIFERDLPGENTTGWVQEGMQISAKNPLETCTTMNGMWGYRIQDQNYKTLDQIIALLVRTSGHGANLLMNIGPQPNGELPATALSRLKELGQWMRRYGSTIKGTRAGDIKPQDWGATTRKGDHLYVHVTDHNASTVTLPLQCKVKSAVEFETGATVACKKTADGYVLTLNTHQDKPDYILDLTTK